jgi:hypothetical protein
MSKIKEYLKSQKGDGEGIIILLILGVISLIGVVWFISKIVESYNRSTLWPVIILVCLLGFAIYWIIKQYREWYIYNLGFWGWVTSILVIIAVPLLLWAIWAKIDYSVVFITIYFILVFVSLVIGAVLIVRRFNARHEAQSEYNPIGNYEPIKSVPMKEVKENKLSTSIDEALISMDTVQKYYIDEPVANSELVAYLIAKGFKDTIYQYRLSSGRTVDAKVGDAFIECKLSPSTKDVDTLIGQISEYVEFTKELHIVIFGDLDSNSKFRINKDMKRYDAKMVLHYLENPKRKRKNND